MIDVGVGSPDVGELAELLRRLGEVDLFEDALFDHEPITSNA